MIRQDLGSFKILLARLQMHSCQLLSTMRKAGSHASDVHECGWPGREAELTKNKKQVGYTPNGHQFVYWSSKNKKRGFEVSSRWVIFMDTYILAHFLK